MQFCWINVNFWRDILTRPGSVLALFWWGMNVSRPERSVSGLKHTGEQK